jgi:hypothetical protein
METRRIRYSCPVLARGLQTPLSSQSQQFIYLRVPEQGFSETTAEVGGIAPAGSRLAASYCCRERYTADGEQFAVLWAGVRPLSWEGTHCVRVTSEAREEQVMRAARERGQPVHFPSGRQRGSGKAALISAGMARAYSGSADPGQQLELVPTYLFPRLASSLSLYPPSPPFLMLRWSTHPTIIQLRTGRVPEM